jgi:hypothetical protein
LAIQRGIVTVQEGERAGAAFPMDGPELAVCTETPGTSFDCLNSKCGHF